MCKSTPLYINMNKIYIKVNNIVISSGALRRNIKYMMI